MRALWNKQVGLLAKDNSITIYKYKYLDNDTFWVNRNGQWKEILLNNRICNQERFEQAVNSNFAEWIKFNKEEEIK